MGSPKSETQEMSSVGLGAQWERAQDRHSITITSIFLFRSRSFVRTHTKLKPER